jgi:gliding motility-associated-like protein
LWTPAAGLSATTISDPVANPTSTTTYSLTVTDANGCTNSSAMNLTINALPIPKFISLDKCFNNATPFTDQSTGGPTQWSWNFGDGNSAVQQNPSHTYASAGNYLVTLVATNGFGCKDSIQHHVIVNPIPVASFASNTVCIGNATSFTDHSSITSGSVSGWSWNFGDPASGANNISNLQDPSHVYPAAGNYTVILTATSDSGCQSTTNFIAMVQPPPVASFTVPAVCANTSTQFTDGSTAANQWKWQFGDGATSGIQNPAHTYAGYGTYVATLIVTSAGGCRDTAMDTVIVNALPVVNFSADTVCQGKTTHFAGFTSIPNGTLTSWNWNFGDVASGTSDTTSLQNPAHVFTQAGTFSVTFSATSNMGCVSTQTLAVPVHPLPAAAFSFSPGPVISITDNVAFNNLSSGGVSWTWSFGDNTSPTHAQNPMHIFTDTGTYVITQIVVSQFGCVDSIKHVLETKDFTFYIPNAFTPNGDGKNEYFFGKGIGITQYEMWIFDRWGNLIFYCNVNGLPQSQPCWWDGTVKGGSGTIVQQDVYVWKVHFTNVFSNTYNYIGTVTVVK